MIIGLLAYHSVCNFGAFLQLLSTVEFLRKNGHTPKVINWIPNDLKNSYDKRSLQDVRDLYSKLRNQYYPMTDLCQTVEDIAEIIKKEHIEAVIIGSDAVCQHHPFLERFHFPTKRIFYIAHPTSDRMFPNPFWGTFNKYLKTPIPVAMISGSSQDSQYKYIIGKKKKQMSKAIQSFRYISVRDDWTRKMISYLTDGIVVPQVTPDPVFAFNQNAGHLVLSKDEIIKKFAIPEKYFLISFKGNKFVDQNWITEFELAAEKQGFACVKLPYADFPAFGSCKYIVEDVLSPLDWYGLIKYSQGYVGNNMHPIVVSLHNQVPFFSFDNYGISEYEQSSKIYHILKTADMLKYRVFTRTKNYNPPDYNKVISDLMRFDRVKAARFSESYFASYQQMMTQVIKNF